MNREYHKWHSSRLGREMELLIFGHTGRPTIVFPTSGGRFFEFEDCGMVGAIAGQVENGNLQLYCVDSVNLESWYNRRIVPRARIALQTRYEEYLLHEVLPLVRQNNSDPRLMTLGCSFGGYHAANIAFRHPDLFTGMVSLSGAFDLSSFLDGYYDQDCYFNLPTHYLPNLNDPWYLNRFEQSSYILATGWDDQCLDQNRNLHRILESKQIPHRFEVWDAPNSHDWPTWQRMVQKYL